MPDNLWWTERPLLRRIWITKAARFSAHRRLLKKKSLNLYLNTSLSVLLIAISLATTMLPDFFGQSALKMLATYTICASVISIVLSLIDEKEATESKAEQLHACARELTEIFNKYSDEFLESKDVREAVQHEYQRSLERCPINHDDLDFESVRHSSPELFDRKKSHYLYYIRYTLDVYFKFMFVIALNALAIFFMLSR
ncbi:MAG: SLATT domain-containing protein [Hyphomicrobiales bacterium]|nr:SLATT domain-containing protein [Hyphomicrobiales bacterium]